MSTANPANAGSKEWIGLAPVFTLATGVVVGSAPPERAGAASAISETTAELGWALGIAVLGSIGTAIYRRELSEAIPTGLPSQALDTLAGAVHVANQLTGDSGAMLSDAARQAFIQGLHLSILVSVALSSVAAEMIFLALRKIQDRQQDEKSVQAFDGPI